MAQQPRPGLLARLFRSLIVIALGFALGVIATIYAGTQRRGEVDRILDAASRIVDRVNPGAARSSASPASRSSSAARAEVRLLDFGAEWCAPCKVQEPIIENLAVNYNGRVVVTKIDVDKNPQLADRYAVEAVPTLIIERNGQIASRFAGLQEEAVLARALDAALN